MLLLALGYLSSTHGYLTGTSILHGVKISLIIGISAIGRVTVDELQLNRPKLVAYRKAVTPFGVHPPK